MSARTTALLMVAGAIVANAAFIALGAVFDYPDVLQRPTPEVLTDFRAHQAPVMMGFALLAAGAGLLAPISVGLRALVRPGAARLVVVLGVLAALVQVTGLLRWIVVVPTLAWQGADPALATAAAGRFDTFDTVLGVLIGETAGYALTAAWTVVLARSLQPRAPQWLRFWAYVAAALVALGTLVPLGVPGADLANFIGYVGWSGWLVALAVRIWRQAGAENLGLRVSAPVATMAG